MTDNHRYTPSRQTLKNRLKKSPSRNISRAIWLFELLLRKFWRTVSFSMLLMTGAFFWFLLGKKSNIPEAMGLFISEFKMSADTLSKSINTLAGAMRNQQAYNDWYHGKLNERDSSLDARLDFLEYRVSYMAEQARKRRAKDE